MWKLHAKLEENRRTYPAENKKITKASTLKIGQLVFVKDNHRGTFDPTCVYDHRVSGVLNDSSYAYYSRWEREEVQHLSHQTNDTSRCLI